MAVKQFTKSLKKKLNDSNDPGGLPCERGGSARRPGGCKLRMFLSLGVSAVLLAIKVCFVVARKDINSSYFSGCFRA